MKVYLDNAASTPMNQAVFEHMRPYLCEYIGNPSSTHAHGRRIRNAIEEARRSIAGHLHAQPGEIYFTSGGTEADNTAILGAVKAFDLKRIISTQIEHHAVTHCIERLAETGQVTAHWLAVDEQGHIDLAELEQVLTQGPPSLVSLMHGNNEIGTLHDLAAIGTLCDQHGAYFHSDTVQTMGHFAYKLSELPIHFLAASAHKFYGPKGIGFLFVRKGLKIPALICGGGQERNLRAGTENPACIQGMAYALEHCQNHLENKRAYLWDLKQYMMTQLEAEIPGVRFHGDTTEEGSLPTVLNVGLPCGDQDCLLLFNLDLKGISASGGSACNSGAVQGSHVLRELGLPQADLMNAIRFSFGPQNTRAEIDYTLACLKEIMPTPAL